LGLCPLWRTGLDAGGVLRSRGSRHRHHRQQRLQAHPQDDRQGSAARRHFSSERRLYGAYRIRKRLAVSGRRGSGVDGKDGAALAALGTFLPCYLFTIIPAPYFKKYGSRPGIKAFVDGVTAAAIGAIAGAVIVLARQTLFEKGWPPDWVKIVIGVVTLGILLR